MASRFGAALVAAAITIGGVNIATSVAGAAQPPGQKGYEGQPGNQGGGHHGHAPGLRGYEGQPGNQGG